MTLEKTTRADLFRKAARRMERREEGCTDYPCWNIAILDGLEPDHWRDSQHVREFLSAFSGEDCPSSQSNDYLTNISVAERGACILSLCFMAAMVEAGDA